MPKLVYHHLWYAVSLHQQDIKAALEILHELEDRSSAQLRSDACLLTDYDAAYPLFRAFDIWHRVLPAVFGICRAAKGDIPDEITSILTNIYHIWAAADCVRKTHIDDNSDVLLEPITPEVVTRMEALSESMTALVKQIYEECHRTLDFPATFDYR